MSEENIKDNPLVSVVVPVYNGEKYLNNAIESILSQTYRPFEIIIVDDGSTDRSREIALSYENIHYIFQENTGHATARNHGILAANGSYIALLDTDDIWLPTKLSLQMEAFSVDPDLDLVTGYVKQFICPELNKASNRKENFVSQPIPGYMPSAILIKQSFFNRIGLFHENVRVGEFISWFVWVLEHDPKIKVLPDVLAMRRIHGGNISIQQKQEKNQAMLRILKSSLDRKRG